MRTLGIGLRATGLGLLTLALVCAGSAHDRAQALDNVTLITDFGFNGRHAYFYVAIEKGYYKAAGLDVKVVRGQGSVDAIRQVGANNAIVGFADAGSLVLARGNDQIPVKLVSIVYAKPAQAVFCREDSGLKQPKDLEGASIANPAGGATVDMFPIYAKAAGFDASKVKWVVAGSDALPGLLAGKRVPCVGQFTVGAPLLTRQVAPAKLVRFAFADAGVSFYGNGIIATDTTIATKPDIVKRFVAATIRGMKDAFANPEEAGQIIHKYHPTIDIAVAKGETEAVAELAQVKGQELGVIDPARIEETINVIKGVFKLKTPVTVNDVYAPGFVSK
jgi:NitT/TauT family transport system substrate-binding protein